MAIIGTRDLPLVLSSALAGNYPNILPGDTVYLIADVYTDDITINISGESGNPITITPEPGGIVIIDGNLIINGDYLIIEGDHRLVCRWSGWPSRVSVVPGSVATDLGTAVFEVYGTNVQIRHCIIHDMSSVGILTDASNSHLYGNIAYYQGWLGPDRDHGVTGAYTQNNTPLRTHKHNIWFNGFRNGAQAYSATNNQHNNMRFEENIVFGAGALEATSDGVNLSISANVDGDNIQIINNRTYNGAVTGLKLGDPDNALTNVVLTDNIFPDGAAIEATVSFLENSNNTTAPLSATTYSVFSDDYNVDVAYCVMYNPLGLSTVDVDVSAVFNNGDTINAWNVQAGVDGTGAQQDVQTLVVAGDGTITINMEAANRSIATPYQWTAPATTFPEFGAFVLLRQ